MERSFVWLTHWGGLLRDRAGRLDVSAACIAFAASLPGVEALINSMPIHSAAELSHSHRLLQPVLKEAADRLGGRATIAER